MEVRLKRYLVIILASLCTLCATAEDACEIFFCLDVIPNGEIPDDINNRFKRELKGILTKENIIVCDYETQFFILGELSPDNLEKINGEYLLDAVVQICVGDTDSEKTFMSTNYNIRGHGKSIEKAYINALSKFRNSINQSDLSDFIAHSKQKAISYYNNNYPQILFKAKRAIATKRLIDAFEILYSIPECCDGYPDAEILLEDGYTEYIEEISNNLLNEARAYWGASPDSDGAQCAMALLSQIPFYVTCYDSAQSLMDQIANEVKIVVKNEDESNKEDDAISDVKKTKVKKAKELGQKKASEKTTYNYISKYIRKHHKTTIS